MSVAWGLVRLNNNVGRGDTGVAMKVKALVVSESKAAVKRKARP
jgi:hypothetical protein